MTALTLLVGLAIVAVLLVTATPLKLDSPSPTSETSIERKQFRAAS